MQTLKLADDLMPMARDGTKRVTIRSGLREIALGPLCIEPVSAAGGEPVEVQVWSVFSVPFEKIPLSDIRADGGTSHVVMLSGMKRFYPTMGMQTPCTVVCWR